MKNADMFEGLLEPQGNITLTNTRAPLTPKQKTFNRLIGQIEKSREKIQEWTHAIPNFREHYFQKLQPLIQLEMTYKKDLALALVHAFETQKLTQRERQKLTGMIVDLTSDLLDSEAGDDAIKQIYNRYSHSDFDQEKMERIDFLKSVFEDTLGFQLDTDDEFESDEALMMRFHEEIQAKEEDRASKNRQRKKTEKQKAKEAKQELESKLQTQSLREIYRKLASALHPDRAGPDDHEERTLLMQQANDAYARGSLLELLELQWKLEHINETHLSSLSEEKLKHYINMLKNQLKELDHEILALEQGLAYEFGLMPNQMLSPQRLDYILSEDIAATKRGLTDLETMIEHCTDQKQLKLWLKSITMPRQRRHAPLSPFDGRF
jgi:hypothetical protein